MRFLLVGCLATLLLLGCDNNSSQELNSNTNSIEQSNQKAPTKNEMFAYYNQKSDGEIQQIFKRQNIGQCMSEFQSQNIPNASTVCNCVMDNMVQQLPISDLKTMLLPAEYVSTNTMNDIQQRSATAMMQAIMTCSRN
ncbi:hypothetical protein [Moraxella equi]|uniref:Lipoprotein n=2 Tax=Moraxella equi TaxID=60442 RepID=A0A378QW67_9GAMM|nr:hypothetical protein [Moraxella equi]OPH38996.1 hypothetical protein B5J93_04925 [Moraxella equi]STZ04672.1 Uncharacterised protein [Moraxella equi]